MIDVLPHKVKITRKADRAKSMKIKIKQHLTPARAAQIEAARHLIVVLPAMAKQGKLPAAPVCEVLREPLKRWPKDALSDGELCLDLPNRSRSRISLAAIDDHSPAFELLGLARKLLQPHLSQQPRRIDIHLPGLGETVAARMAEALVAAAGAIKPLPDFKRKSRPAPKLDSLSIYNLPARQNFKPTLAGAAGNNLARELTALPPNHLTPALYLKRVRQLAREHGWRLEFLDMPTLKKRKAGAFVAVAQGSPSPDAGIVHLRYTPAKKSNKPACALIGKGICFDTGGMNLKPARYMHGMHEDMEGSAVALGTLLALTELQVDFPVDCWLALAQNHIGPKAYKQNDIVVASNGTSIEIVHTDAEGRMVLADTLAFAAKKKPALMIDYATLTGACVYALGTSYSGAFSNRDDLIDDIIEAGRNSGERVWPFPLDKDYDKALQSTVADIKQCTLEGEADHILASRFLSRFVDDTPWLHVDLSAGNSKGGLAHIPTDITGFGVRFTLDLLLKQKVLQDRKKLSAK
jgi:leucyl aminopeptidase